MDQLFKKGLRAGLLLAAVAASAEALAVTADDVVCTDCVGTADLANGAVGTANLKRGAVATAKIKKGAVTTAKIRNGAVRYQKLDANLKGAVDIVSGLAVTSHADHLKPANVTKKVFNLSGDFGTCGGAGNPDTEVRTFNTTNLGGGVKKEVQTRKRFVGGAGGTLCTKLFVTLIKGPDGVQLVQQKVYNGAGVLKKDYDTDYDASTCTDCGLLLSHNNMVQGIDWASGSKWTESVSGASGLVLSKAVLVGSGDSETINEGTASAETFNNCMTTWEDRRTSGPWGNRSTLRITCQDMGIVLAAQVDNTGGTPVERLWELTSYTTN